jgi:hypothetical protein
MSKTKAKVDVPVKKKEHDGFEPLKKFEKVLEIREYDFFNDFLPKARKILAKDKFTFRFGEGYEDGDITIDVVFRENIPYLSVSGEVRERYYNPWLTRPAPPKVEGPIDSLKLLPSLLEDSDYGRLLRGALNEMDSYDGQSLEITISGGKTTSSENNLTFSISGFPSCCGVYVFCEIPEDGTDAKLFSAFITSWQQYCNHGLRGESKRSTFAVYLTHQVNTTLFKELKKSSNVEITDRWKNRNTDNELFMAKLVKTEEEKEIKSKTKKKEVA